MALSDLLLLAAIVLVLAILGAGGYILMFRKRFSFLKRPYPETGERLSKRLGIPTEAPADVTNETIEIAEEHPGAAIKIPEFATGVMEIARDLTPVEHEPSSTQALVVPTMTTRSNAPASLKRDDKSGYVPGSTSSKLQREQAPTEAKNSLTGITPAIDLASSASGLTARPERMRSTGRIAHHTSQITTMEIAEEFPVGGSEPSAVPPIPWSYGECKITALVRDPYWLFAYWEINEAKRGGIAQRYGSQSWGESRPVLRVYDATNLYFFDSRHYVEISINDYANDWYIRIGQPNRTFCIELGRVRPDGSYIFLARSNFVSTPRDQISEVIDEEWLLLPEYATRLYRRIGSIYPGPSSPGLMGPAEYISSPGFVGPGRPDGKSS